MVKRSLVVAAAALSVLALFATPASAQYPTGTITAQIDDTTLYVGQLFTVSGQITIDDQSRARAADDPTIVDISFDDRFLGSVPVQPDLSYSGTFPTPDVPLGPHTVFVNYLDAEIPLQVEVIADDGVGSGGAGQGGTGTGGFGDGDSLARTGTSVDLLVKAGGGLLLAGAAVALLSTKRRRSLA
jgi:hypothetical protein